MSIKLTDTYGTDEDYKNSLAHFVVPNTEENKNKFNNFITRHKKYLQKTQKSYKARKQKLEFRGETLTLKQRSRLSNQISVYEKSKEPNYIDEIPDIFHEDENPNSRARTIMTNMTNMTKSIMEKYKKENISLKISPYVNFTVSINRNKWTVIDIEDCSTYQEQIIVYHSIFEDSNNEVDDDDEEFLIYLDKDNVTHRYIIQETVPILRDPDMSLNDRKEMSKTRKIRNSINRDNLQYMKRKYRTMQTRTPITDQINKMVCNVATKDINRPVSCFPDSVIYEIRDAYNENRPENKRINTDNIEKIIRQLYYVFQCETEESFLSILPSVKKRKEYNYKYFAPSVQWNEKQNTFSGTTNNQFPGVFNQYEDLYEDYASICYRCTDTQFQTVFQADILYHDKYKKEYTELISKLKKKDFVNECQYTHMELIRIVRFFMNLNTINQISIYVSHSEHAQAIYINKHEKLFIYFDSSSFHTYDEYVDINYNNTKIRKEIHSLLNEFSNQYLFTRNKQQQYLEGVCGLHAFLFIMTMIDPTMDRKKKIATLNREIDNDDDVRRKIYDYINPNMIHRIVKVTNVAKLLRRRIRNDRI
jgi:hypothetical protein